MSHHTTTNAAIAPQPSGELVASPAFPEMPAFSPAFAEMPDLGALKNAEVSQFQSNPLYHEFAVGQEVLGYFLGYQDHVCPDRQTGELRRLNAAVFITKDGKLKKNAAALFTDYFKDKGYKHPFFARMTGIIPKNGKNIQEFAFFEVTV